MNTPKSNPLIDKEKETQKFWEDNQIFQKTLEATKDGKSYSFYDGPPFATGTPHYGHLVGSVMKDVVPRYQTMQGFYVERKWGWDCHGLPIENIVEKELGFKVKKDIEAFGIDKFNETCRSKVLVYTEEWKKTIGRIGRWADMENSYKTMDLDYMESVWWVFKELWDRKLIYKDYKVMHICPRCETTLSQMEVSEGYKDVTDPSVIVKFESVDEPGTFFLAWTTTPWTLPGNSALYLNKDFTYMKVKVKGSDELYIVAKDSTDVFEEEFEVVSEHRPEEFVGKKYKPLYDYFTEIDEKYYHVDLADFVTLEQGTGVVHSAIMYGDVDFQRAKEQGLKPNHLLNMDGRFKDEAKIVKGLFYKDADKVVLEDLKKRGLALRVFNVTHPYPHCWRCDTPLINYATSSWFVKVTDIKDKALKEAKEINWSPKHIKEGRFGNWLEGARDWAISRQRFWASVMPIWECECGERKVFGDIAELEKLSGKKITDLHKHIIDLIKIPCKKCKGEMSRVPDVLDTWFDSGSMPYAQSHYPFENEKKVDDNFPAEFIAEGPDQTRAWFYYLHVIATAIKGKPAYKNVIVNGIVLAEDGKKMAKKLQNYPEPDIIMDKYGADALRFYLLSSPVMLTENLNFSEDGVKEAFQKVVMLSNNILKFYKIYAPEKGHPEEKSHPELVSGSIKTKNILDLWLLSKLHTTIEEVTKQMEEYNLPKSVRPLQEFIDEFSTWWLRRSRDRFKGEDKDSVLTVFRYTLLELSKLMAPFTPFMAENIYKEIGGELESVHLEKWPETDKKMIDEKVVEQMDRTRKIIELGLAERAEKGVKIRQPLSSLKVEGSKLKGIDEDYLELIKDEVNVKEVIEGKVENVALDTKITEELKVEGMLRELVRSINSLRKKQGLSIGDSVKVAWQSDGETIKKVFANADMVEELKKSTITSEFMEKENAVEEIKMNEEAIKIEIKK